MLRGIAHEQGIAAVFSMGKNFSYSVANTCTAKDFIIFGENKVDSSQKCYQFVAKISLLYSGSNSFPKRARISHLRCSFIEFV